MSTLKNIAVLDLAARLLQRPPAGPIRPDETDETDGPADNLAPLAEQCLKTLEDSSLPGPAALDELAAALNAAAKNGEWRQ